MTVKTTRKSVYSTKVRIISKSPGGVGADSIENFLLSDNKPLLSVYWSVGQPHVQNRVATRLWTAGARINARSSPCALRRTLSTPAASKAQIASTSHRFQTCGRPPDAGRHNEHPRAIWWLLSGSGRPGVPIGAGGTTLSLADASRQGKLPFSRDTFAPQLTCRPFGGSLFSTQDPRAPRRGKKRYRRSQIEGCLVSIPFVLAASKAPLYNIAMHPNRAYVLLCSCGLKGRRIYVASASPITRYHSF